MISWIINLLNKTPYWKGWSFPVFTSAWYEIPLIWSRTLVCLLTLRCRRHPVPSIQIDHLKSRVFFFPFIWIVIVLGLCHRLSFLFLLLLWLLFLLVPPLQHHAPPAPAAETLTNSDGTNGSRRFFLNLPLKIRSYQIQCNIAFLIYNLTGIPHSGIPSLTTWILTK